MGIQGKKELSEITIENEVITQAYCGYGVALFVTRSGSLYSYNESNWVMKQHTEIEGNIRLISTHNTTAACIVCGDNTVYVRSNETFIRERDHR